MPEIEKIKFGSTATLSEDEKSEEVDKILESRYPSIIENKKCYQLLPLEEIVLILLENFYD